MTSAKHVKIAVRFYSDLFENEMVETLWAIVVDSRKGWYQLDSIPFYAPLMASDDIVFAEFDNREHMLTYRRTVRNSGNSTVQVAVMDKATNIHTIRELFRDLGCTSEQVNDGYFSMEIPKSLNYRTIKQKLDELEAKELIAYSEPCLADGHSY